jgi:acyl-homoserine-lactone acylase
MGACRERRPLAGWLGLTLGLALGLAAMGGAARAAAAGGGEILWDRYGVAHVYAKTTQGMFYGYGFAQAKSHGNAVLKLYAQARGRAAEYFGPSELPNDRWMAINGVPERTAAWMKLQSPDFRGYLEAFAAGFNGYAKAHPEAFSAEAKRVLPISGTDVMAHSLRLFQYVYLAPEGIERRPRAVAVDPLEPAPEPAGSNGWAISPARSASGHSMLLMNPHLPWATGWSTYYEIQMSGPGMDLYGASQIGLPVLRFMFSDYLGFTQTVDNVGGVTFYRLKTAPGGYVYDGKVLPFTVKTYTLKARQADGSLASETLTVRSTVQGPVVAEKDGAPVAMRVVGLDRPKALEQYWRMATAHDFAGYQDALRMMQVPSFNVLYADRDGHIEFLMNGLVPKKPGRDFKFWQEDVPGDRSSTLWTDYLSYEELPKAIDPKVGVVQNSNDPPWDAAWPAVEDPKPYANQIVADQVTLRMARGIRMLGQTPTISYEDLIAKKWSTRSELADRIIPDLQEAVQAYGTDLAKQAMAVLDRWDRTTQADSKGSLLFLDWVDQKGGISGYAPAGWARPYDLNHPLTTPWGIKDPKAAAAALDAAAKDMMAKRGTLETPWGQAMRIRLGDKDLPANGGPGRLGVFDVLDYTPPLPDGTRTANFGGTYVALISFDGPVRAKVLMSYGNASQPGSPHIADQAPLLAKQTLRDAWRTRAEVEANLESRDGF